jgi:hypothetical protein
MPDDADHALPLRIERTRTELRIEAQTVIAELAGELQVDIPVTALASVQLSMIRPSR